MRHIPASLYIDTEFFKRQGLRFDTKAFKALTATFVKGGLRLLVPSIMERELFRHFAKEAEKAANAVITAHKAHPVSNLALFEFFSQEDLKAKCIEEMNRQWSSFKEVVDRLGQHLFTYYLWEVFPLTGADSLLELYYNKTNGDRQRWAQLFDHVGRSLNNSGKRLDKELTDRAIAYFDWRLEAAEPQELQEFTFWLEAECLDPEWRLRSFSEVLSVVKEKDEGHYMEVEALSKMLQDHLTLVVECFAKITDVMDRDKHLFISEDEAKPILKAGLNAQDPQTRENAERARENLLRLGRFDFMNLE